MTTRPAARRACAVALGTLAACAPKGDAGRAGDSAAPAPAAAAPDTVGARLAAADVAALRWLAGTWRGTGDVETPFYERYTFVNDSTIEVLGFTDSTLATANDTTVYSLRDGRFGNHDRPSRYVATRATGDRVEFGPVTARNAFVWRRVRDDGWEATILPRTSAGEPGRERRYAMAPYRP